MADRFLASIPSQHLGDWLLAFGGESRAIPSRFSGQVWQPIQEGAEWQLWSCSVSPEWRGFPLRQWHSAAWQFWLLGEVTNLTDIDSLNSEDSIPSPRAIAALNGSFLLWGWERTTHNWHIWTDRFATLHAYYAWDGSRAAYGTFSPAVAAVTSCKKIDSLGLAGFFSYGFFPQDRTYWEEVKILRPATHFILDRTGKLIVHERYWSWQQGLEQQRSYPDTVAEFAALFEAVMSDHARHGRIALPISGGLDSRSTVAALNHSAEHGRERFWSYSYGYTQKSIETRIARQVATTRRLPFEAYTIQPYLFDRLEGILSWTEGFQDLVLARQAFVRDEIAARSDAVICALWGDVWLNDMGLAGRLPGSISDSELIEHMVKMIQKPGGKWLLDHLNIDLPKEETSARLTETVQEELSKLESIADYDFRVKAYKTEQWSFRWSLPAIRVFQSAAWPRLVFYDHRLADFFCSVPSKWLCDRQMQIDYLKRFAPDLAHIIWQPYRANLYAYRYYNSWLLPRRALEKLWRSLTRQQVTERNWEVQFLCPQGRAGLNAWLLRPGLRLHEYFSPASLSQLLADFQVRSLDKEIGYTLSMLVTFSAWLETYG